MRVVFAGTPAVALPALEAVSASRHELVAVVSRPDAPVGRSSRPVPSPVAAWALERGVELLRPARPGEPEFAARLSDLGPDVCPVVAYGALVPEPVLAIPRHGWVNVHFSLLPAYRGAAPVQRAILAGEEVTGISVFRLVRELDAGPVFVAEASPLGAGETSGDVLARLAERGAELLVDVLNGIEDGTAAAVEQPESGASLAPKLTVGDARIDWTAPATGVANLVRACNPNPMAWTTWQGERLKILTAEPEPAEEALAPGRLRVERRRVLVGTGEGAVALGFVQPAGRRAMPAADWGRGLGVAEGAFA